MQRLLLVHDLKKPLSFEQCMISCENIMLVNGHGFKPHFISRMPATNLVVFKDCSKNFVWWSLLSNLFPNLQTVVGNLPYQDVQGLQNLGFTKNRCIMYFPDKQEDFDNYFQRFEIIDQ